MQINPALFSLLLLLGALSGYCIGAHWFRPAGSPGDFYEVRESGYNLISPLLGCGRGARRTSLEPLKDKLQAAVQKQFTERRVKDISVFVKEINEGIEIKIRPSVRFNPASISKVPLMIALLKEAQSDPGLLNVRLKYASAMDPSFGVPQTIDPSKTLKDGGSYTIEDLLNRMMAYSDNRAYSLLLENVDLARLQRTFEILGIPDLYGGFMAPGSEPEDVLTAKQTAGVFSIIYNAAYLSKEMSVKAMSYMTHSDFKDGLVRGVPSNVLVAHKFGECAPGKPGEAKELHDCGIVYYPGDPYLVCVMTKGDSFGQLKTSIADISRVVYEEYDRTHKKAKS